MRDIICNSSHNCSQIFKN